MKSQHPVSQLPAMSTAADDAIIVERAYHAMGDLSGDEAKDMRVLTKALRDVGVNKLGHRLRLTSLLRERIGKPVAAPATCTIAVETTASTGRKVDTEASLSHSTEASGPHTRSSPTNSMPLPPPPQLQPSLAVSPWADAGTLKPVGDGPQQWRVVHFPQVFVRSSPSLNGDKVRALFTGADVRVRSVNEQGWARLDSDAEEWILTNGAAGASPPPSREG